MLARAKPWDGHILRILSYSFISSTDTSDTATLTSHREVLRVGRMSELLEPITSVSAAVPAQDSGDCVDTVAVDQDPASSAAEDSGTTKATVAKAAHIQASTCIHCGKRCGNAGAKYNHERKCLEMQARQRDAEAMRPPDPLGTSDSQEQSPGQQKRVASAPAQTQSVVCRHCGKTCGNAGARYNHEQRCLAMQERAVDAAREVRERPSPPSGEGRGLACRHCGKVCGNAGGLMSHEMQCLAMRRRLGAHGPHSASGTAALPRHVRAAPALEAAEAEGLELDRDPHTATGFRGVTAFGATDIRYRASMPVLIGRNEKRKICVLGVFPCPEEAALCVARRKKLLSQRQLPFPMLPC